MKRSPLILTLLVLLLIVTAFLALDFQVARSATRAEHRLASYRMGDERPEAMQPGAPLALAVSGRGAFVEALREALAEELGASILSAGVELLEAAADPDGKACLLVELERQTILWTPFYGRTRLAIVVTYSSDGDLSWRGTSPIVMESGEGPVVWGEGDFQLTDTSGGLLSRPAYQRLVARHMALEIARALETIY